MIVIGILIWTKFDLMIRKKLKYQLGEQKIRTFKKGLALPVILLGILFISMGILEEMNVFETPVFLTIYIAMSIILLGMILINNKKHLGRYCS